MLAAVEYRLSNMVLRYLSLPCSRCSPFMRTLLDGFKLNLVNASTLSLPLLNFKKGSVFANNYLNLDDVKVIGFDLDYTLVTYTEELQQTIYDLARDILIKKFGFPASLQDCSFDPSFAVRGLSVDTKHGVLCKLSHVQRVGLRSVYKGRKSLSPAEIEEIFGESRHVSVGEINQMRPLNDQFAMAEACLIADSIELFEHKRITTAEGYSATAVLEDVRSAIEEVHISGAMHREVLRDLDKYIIIPPNLPQLLTHLKEGGKSLFLCTNSGPSYTEHALAKALGIPPRHVDKKEWSDLFDLVICSARKPEFYKSSRPFRLWDSTTQSPLPLPINELKKGNIYINGSVQTFRSLKKSTSGKEVLYIGDNLWTDLVEARRLHGWQTACVIHELDDEIDVQLNSTFCHLHYLRSMTRSLLTKMQEEMEVQRKAMGAHSLGEEDILLVKDLDAELKFINQQMSAAFNPYFGSVFRTDGNPTLFAFNIRRYVDLYMSKVSDLLTYSTSHRFFPSHPILMAHDPKVRGPGDIL